MAKNKDYTVLNILCFVFSIISIPLFCIYLIGGFFALASLVLGIIYLVKGKGKKYFSIIGISISSVILLLCCLFLFIKTMDKMSEISNNINNQKTEYQIENSVERETETETQTEIKTEIQTEKPTGIKTKIENTSESIDNAEKKDSNPLKSILCLGSFMFILLLIVSYIEKMPPADNSIKCPKCKSTNLVPIDTDKKFSMGKAVVGNTVGGLLGGPVGAIVGAGTGIKGKNGKTKFYCQNCGNVFEKKI